ncbi:hypothetical protein [Fluviicola sp.]|uniref:hypothetical protein n=1 Tax=Fluviicola sp. TaxID=1917219 RepID=UPI0026022C5E|nr:hypothetical protein [Fluviicola sp.]
MSNANQILERIKGIRRFQPSVIRNSLMMAMIQLVSLVGAVGLIALSIVKLTSSEPPKDHVIRDLEALSRFNMDVAKEAHLIIAYLLLFGAILLLLIWRLTRMVRHRNAYILELNEVLDGEE